MGLYVNALEIPVVHGYTPPRPEETMEARIAALEVQMKFLKDDRDHAWKIINSLARLIEADIDSL